MENINIEKIINGYNNEKQILISEYSQINSAYNSEKERLSRIKERLESIDKILKEIYDKLL